VDFVPVDAWADGLLLAAERMRTAFGAMKTIAAMRPTGDPEQMVIHLRRVLRELDLGGDLAPGWEAQAELRLLAAVEHPLKDALAGMNRALRVLDDALDDAVAAGALGEAGDRLIATNDFGRVVLLGSQMGSRAEDDVSAGIIETLPDGHRLRYVLPVDEQLLHQERHVLLLGPPRFDGYARAWYPENRALELTRVARKRQLAFLEQHREEERKAAEQLERRYAQSEAGQRAAWERKTKVWENMLQEIHQAATGTAARENK
jgi:hypothetical protein